MTWDRPIFNQGIPGANRATVNLWTRGAAKAIDATQTIDRAATMLDGAKVIPLGLVRIQAATAYGASGTRWEYQVASFFPPSRVPGADIAEPTQSTLEYDGIREAMALNLREWFNTATRVDGNDITYPVVSVGPVGSYWIPATQAWALTALEAVTMLYVTHDLRGKAFAFFDRPNPTRCVEQFTGE